MAPVRHCKQSTEQLRSRKANSSKPAVVVVPAAEDPGGGVISSPPAPAGVSSPALPPAEPPPNVITMSTKHKLAAAVVDAIRAAGCLPACCWRCVCVCVSSSIRQLVAKVCCVLRRAGRALFIDRSMTHCGGTKRAATTYIDRSCTFASQMTSSKIIITSCEIESISPTINATVRACMPVTVRCMTTVTILSYIYCESVINILIVKLPIVYIHKERKIESQLLPSCTVVLLPLS